MKFLEDDDTDLCSYIPNNFVCKHFAEMLQAHAFAENINSNLVGIKVEYATEGHACVEFETSDKGKVYIDPTGEPGYRRKGRTIGETNPKLGEIYQRQLLFSEGVSSPLGKVSDIFKEGDVGFDQKWGIRGEKRYTVKIPISNLQEQHLCTNQYFEKGTRSATENPEYAEPIYCSNFCLDAAVGGVVRVLEEFKPAPDPVTGLERNLNQGYSFSLNQNTGHYDIISSEGNKVVYFERDKKGILSLSLSSNLEASKAVKIPIISAVLLLFLT
jgi:hypothetical protein